MGRQHTARRLGPQQARVYLTLRAAIENGHLKLGQQLANQVELAAQHGVALATLNQTLQALEHDGYIVRRQGVGTFVANTLPPVADPLRALAKYSAQSFSSREEAISALLTMLGEQTGMRSAFLSHIEQDRLEIVADYDQDGCGIRAGASFPVDDAF